MKTEDLTAIGLTKEQVDSVFKLHGQEVNDLNAQVSTLTAERDGYQSQVEDVKQNSMMQRRQQGTTKN